MRPRRLTVHTAFLILATTAVFVTAGAFTTPKIVAPTQVTAEEPVYGTAYGFDPITVTATWLDTLEGVAEADTTSGNGKNEFCFRTTEGDAGRTMAINMKDHAGNDITVYVEIVP